KTRVNRLLVPTRGSTNAARRAATRAAPTCKWLNPAATTIALQTDRRAHEISLAKFNAAMSQNVVGRRAVKIEIRQDEIEQQPLPVKFGFIGTKLELIALVFGAVDLRRLNPLQKVDSPGEPCLEVGKCCFRIRHVRHGPPRQRAAAPGRMRARLL